MQNTDSENIQVSGFFKTPQGGTIEIREVWASNLDAEMEIIQQILEKYPYVAMDTEFPGVVARPNGDFGPNEIVYQTLRCNVDLLKIIQLGLTFTDGQGNWAEGCTCWQFNFKFSLSDDIYAEDSIELLKSSGINFQKFQSDGIDVQYFGEILTMSGLVLNNDIKWISFHSYYDFGYLLKVLTCTELPFDEQSFLDLLHIFFPCIYDVKFMMTAVEGVYGGLSALADTLQVDRIGPTHQAGSDSMLTAQTYFSLIKKHLGGNCDDTKFKGELFGLGNNHTKYKSKGYNNSSNGSTATGISVVRSMSIESSSYTSAVHYATTSSMNTITASASNTSIVGGGPLQHAHSVSGYSIYDESSTTLNDSHISGIYNSP